MVITWNGFLVSCLKIMMGYEAPIWKQSWPNTIQTWQDSNSRKTKIQQDRSMIQKTSLNPKILGSQLRILNRLIRVGQPEVFFLCFSPLFLQAMRTLLKTEREKKITDHSPYTPIVY